MKCIVKDWIKQLCPEIADWQADLIAQEWQNDLLGEREKCAKLADAWDETHPNTNYGKCIGADIRARWRDEA